MNKVYMLIITAFVLFVLYGCLGQKQQTLVVTDYVSVPANQVVVPKFEELQQAAKQGDAAAQYNLGKLYADGLGVAKNHKTAMLWWEKSASQGYAPAQYGLGWMYFNGKRVINDSAKGCNWMKKAAAQGIQEAISYHNEFCPK